MKSLRALLSALLSLLKTAVARVRGENRTHSRPAQGPAHPWAYAHAKWRRAKRHDDAVELGAGHLVALDARHLVPSPPRPARAPLPPHLAALLANAPDVEPEFARRRAPALMAPLRRIAAHARVYNPRPAPSARRVVPPLVASIPERVARVLDHVTRWLVTASPARRVRTEAIA